MRNLIPISKVSSHTVFDLISFSLACENVYMGLHVHDFTCICRYMCIFCAYMWWPEPLHWAQSWSAWPLWQVSCLHLPSAGSIVRPPCPPPSLCVRGSTRSPCWQYCEHVKHWAVNVAPDLCSFSRGCVLCVLPISKAVYEIRCAIPQIFPFNKVRIWSQHIKSWVIVSSVACHLEHL